MFKTGSQPDINKIPVLTADMNPRGLSNLNTLTNLKKLEIADGYPNIMNRAEK
jgi:hypothetical protein